jgi:hypothetical protein
MPTTLDGSLSTWLLVAVFIVTSGTFGTLGAQWLQRRKTSSEADQGTALADQTLEVTRASVLEMIQQGTDQLRDDLDSERAQREKLETVVRRLREKVDRGAETVADLRAVIAYLANVATQAVTFLSTNDMSVIEILPEPLRSHVDGLPLLPKGYRFDRRSTADGHPYGSDGDTEHGKEGHHG